MIVMIDNYDSFTYNLVQYLGELGEELRVVRNDQTTVAQVRAMQPAAIVISPGPGTPREAGISNELITACAGRIPILGVCLGHQCIGEAYGGDIVRAGRPVHGRTSPIAHDASSVLADLPTPFQAARYHSLVIARPSLPDSLRAFAFAEDDGEIMAVAHREHPVVGVQFHPESAATEYGYWILDRFLIGRDGLEDQEGITGGDQMPLGFTGKIRKHVRTFGKVQFRRFGNKFFL